MLYMNFDVVYMNVVRECCVRMLCVNVVCECCVCLNFVLDFICECCECWTSMSDVVVGVVVVMGGWCWHAP